MKVALDAFELSPYLMAQPLGYRVPDGGSFGWVEIPEFPFSVEPRQITRWEARRWARQAYELGVRFIGGCCGFEPYHIRFGNVHSKYRKTLFCMFSGPWLKSWQTSGVVSQWQVTRVTMTWRSIVIWRKKALKDTKIRWDTDL